MQGFLSHPLTSGAALGYWRLGPTVEARFDLPDLPMKGEMDPFFFLTKDKNFIPHEYPCRTQFAADRRDRRPPVQGGFAPARNWLPFGSPRLDLSGFWFRPTHIATWAETVIRARSAGTARLRLRTCGGAVLFVNGAEAGWMAPYKRNAETGVEFSVSLKQGDNAVQVFFDDLAERDARYYIQLDWLDGPEAEGGIPTACATDRARAMETALASMHFDQPAYTGGEVALVLPHTMPMAVEAAIRVEGDFMSHHPAALQRHLPAGAARLVIDRAENLPGDFRHFIPTLTADGFSATRTFGVEVCDLAAQGSVPATLEARIDEALTWVATRAEPDTVAALARLAQGLSGPETEAMIDATLPAIEDCWDCADFALVPLLWGRTRFGHLLSDRVRDRIDAAILGYRYWMDEPGNDVQWYFSENHALLFHTSAYLAGHLLPDATFRRSGRSGAEQSATGRERVRAWLDHFEQWEMAEFNSAPYFPIDLKGLTALYALSPDADIRARAGRAVVRLIEVVANSAHHGVITAAQGRSYEHTLRAGRTLELSAITRMLWGMGQFGARFHCLPGLALALRDHGLQLDAALSARASLTEGEQEWMFAQGEGRFAALYHAKTADWAMGSAAAYRWFDWGYQETLLHARMGRNPDAQIWINHPGEVIHSGYGRPSYWGGSASVPRVQQYRGLALVWFDGQPEQPDFTHCWFPGLAFDDKLLQGDLAAVVADGAGMVIRASGTLEMVAEGPTAGCELRLAGRHGWWIVRMGRAAQGLEAYVAQFAQLTPDQNANVRATVTVEDPEYGTVMFHADGRIEAEGRMVNPKDWTVVGQRTLHR
ncbi:hypothetical protein [Pseudotabrizicola algicola]|uniref:Uncharacterized protein n=1 Tax=Pseudotabrizicola algicola TaxID=2709381 RepID=A0A6B3RJT8_9RHOB|nr:hypothetical protein [Pseudotabrizicola algicola]NEX45413.1 hypothetical protein [Pseudotabrizicola algicola]